MIIGLIIMAAGIAVSFLAFLVGSTHPTPSQTNIGSWFAAGLVICSLGAIISLADFIRWLI